MKHTNTLITSIFAVILCLMLVFSIADTVEVRYDTSFDQEAMLTHIEHLTEHGPRSIYDATDAAMGSASQ